MLNSPKMLWGWCCESGARISREWGLGYTRETWQNTATSRALYSLMAGTSEQLRALKLEGRGEKFSNLGNNSSAVGRLALF